MPIASRHEYLVADLEAPFMPAIRQMGQDEAAALRGVRTRIPPILPRLMGWPVYRALISSERQFSDGHASESTRLPLLPCQIMQAILIAWLGVAYVTDNSS